MQGGNNTENKHKWPVIHYIMRPFRVTEANLDDVVRYLERKIARDHMSDVMMTDITHFKTAEQVQDWCDDRRNLDMKEWRYLVRAIQKQNEREKIPKWKKSDTKTITVSSSALDFLQEI